MLLRPLNGRSAFDAYALGSHSSCRAAVPDSPTRVFHYLLVTVDGNQVVGVALQPGRRIAFLGLRDGVGPFVPRTLTISDVKDRRDQALPSQALPIETPITGTAGVVAGQVLGADGRPVAFAEVRLLHTAQCTGGPVTVGVSVKRADDQGHYGFDYVRGDFATKILAINTESEESRSIGFSISMSLLTSTIAAI